MLKISKVSWLSTQFMVYIMCIPVKNTRILMSSLEFYIPQMPGENESHIGLRAGY